MLRATRAMSVRVKVSKKLREMRGKLCNMNSYELTGNDSTRLELEI
jgi:hypothetical protein